MAKKTGVSTGTIINVSNSPIFNKVKKMAKDAEKRAKSCIGCKDNKEGWCDKHNGWCGKVNFICLGIKDPYTYKPPKSKKKSKKKKRI